MLGKKSVRFEDLLVKSEDEEELVGDEGEEDKGERKGKGKDTEDGLQEESYSIYE